MSNTEKLIKQLNENKEIRKLQEKVVKPAVRIQQVKNNLIILRIITDNLDNVYSKFYKYMNEQDFKTVSEDYLNF